jgi:hypothetical protein
MLFFSSWTAAAASGLVDLHSSFFNEDRGHDKEDQKDEDHVDHRREVDLYVVAFV